MPTSVCSPLGFISLRSAGSIVPLRKNAMIHAVARNQAKLGKTGIIRRDERKETSRRCERGQRQRR